MRIVVSLLLVLCLAGCGGVKGLVDFAKNAYQLEQALKQDFGDDIVAHANMQNGALSVTVTFPSTRFQTVTVGDLERKVKARVASFFKQPLDLYVAFHSSVKSQ